MNWIISTNDRGWKKLVVITGFVTEIQSVPMNFGTFEHGSQSLLLRQF